MAVLIGPSEGAIRLVYGSDSHSDGPERMLVGWRTAVMTALRTTEI